MTKYTTNYLPCSDDKKPFGGKASWLKFKTTLYKGDFKKYPKRGVITGGISDGLTALDFDNHSGAGCIFGAFVERLKEQGGADILKRCTLETTPRDGVHLYYRVHDQQRAEDLAKRSKAGGGVEDIIELKASGAFVCCFPSSGYKLTQGTIESAEYITNEQQALLLSVARSFNKVESNKPKPKASNDNTPLLPANNYDDSAAEFLRTKQARPILQQALTSAGYFAIKEHTSDDFGDCVDYAHERANDQKAKLTLCRDNVLHIWAGSVYGGLEYAQSEDLTPLKALTLLRNTTESDTAAYIRRNYGKHFQTMTANNTPLPANYDDEDDDEQPQSESNCGQVDRQFFQHNASKFPALIRQAVNEFALRSRYPQRTLYAFNLLSVVGAFVDAKIMLNGAQHSVRTRLNMFTFSPTSSGKNGIVDAARALYNVGVDAINNQRPPVYLRNKQGDDFELNAQGMPILQPAPDPVLTELTSAQAFQLLFSKLGGYDARQREIMARNAGQQQIITNDAQNIHMLLSIAEAGDLLRGKVGSNAIIGALAEYKKISQSSTEFRYRLDCAINQQGRVKEVGGVTSVLNPLCSALWYTAMDGAGFLRQSDLIGGFVNRFLYLFGEEQADVKRGRVVSLHKPERITQQEISLISTLATTSAFNLVIDADINQRLDDQEKLFCDSLPYNGTQRAVLGRLADSLLPFVALSAILRAYDAGALSEVDESETAHKITVIQQDIDFAALCMGYFKQSALYLLSLTRSEYASAADLQTKEINDAVIAALTGCKSGRKAETLWQKNTELRRVCVNKSKLLKALNDATLCGVVELNGNKYRLKNNR